MNKFAYGLVWAIVFYFGTCVVLGAIAGGQAGANFADPNEAAAAGAEAGRKAVEGSLPAILLGSVAVAALGAVTGILPGTGSNRNPDSSEELEEDIFERDD